MSERTIDGVQRDLPDPNTYAAMTKAQLTEARQYLMATLPDEDDVTANIKWDRNFSVIDAVWRVRNAEEKLASAKRILAEMLDGDA